MTVSRRSSTFGSRALLAVGERGNREAVANVIRRPIAIAVAVAIAIVIVAVAMDVAIAIEMVVAVAVLALAWARLVRGASGVVVLPVSGFLI